MCGAGKAGLVADFVEKALAVILPDVVRGPLKIGDVQIEPAVVIEISQRDAHGRHGDALSGKGHAAVQSDFPEGAVVLVVVEVSAEPVVGDEQVGPTIVVVVAGAYGKIFAFGLVDFGLDTNVGEGPVAVIVIERVRTAAIRTGRATALHSAQVAIAPVAHVNVTADVKIEASVTVIIKEGGAGMKRP